MWLQDVLPRDFSRCRIMLYGYESTIESRNTSSLRDYSIELREEIKTIRHTDQVNSIQGLYQGVVF